MYIDKNRNIFYRRPRDTYIYGDSVVDNKYRLQAQIVGLTHEDGSGESWIVSAYLAGRGGGLRELYFNSKTRTGHIDVMQAPEAS